MRNGTTWGLSTLVGSALVLTLLASVRPTTQAQDKPRPSPEPAPVGNLAKDEARGPSLSDALLMKTTLPFDKPTPLSEVRQYLSDTLHAQVVLDRAALLRAGIEPSAGVELERVEIRLKTGLKLLLDQLGLTYRVVPEDNLLILTDGQGADEPIERIRAELHEMHAELHDIQDTIDEIRTALGLETPANAKLRSPTIIEEMPQEPPLDQGGSLREPSPRHREGL